MSAYLIILSLVVVGRVLARHFPATAPETLNQIVIVFCLPALIFIHVLELEASLALLPLIAVPWLLWLVSVVIVLVLARWMNFRREAVAVLLLLLPLGNTSFRSEERRVGKGRRHLSRRGHRSVKHGESSHR